MYIRGRMVQFPLEARSAFRIFWICGLASVLVDLDHAYAMVLYFTIYPSVVEGRILHPLIFFVTCCLIGYLLSYLGRLYFGHILRRKRDG